MNKRALLASVIGCFSLVLSAAAQETQLSLTEADAGFRSRPEFPALALSDSSRFFFPSSFAWMAAAESPEVLPAFVPSEPRRVRPVAPPPSRDVSEMIAGVQSSPIYTSGEIGFMYGRSTGKYGGDLLQTYIIGEVGNDKFHVTAGASYSESNMRFPRWGR